MERVEIGDRATADDLDLLQTGNRPAAKQRFELGRVARIVIHVEEDPGGLTIVLVNPDLVLDRLADLINAAGLRRRVTVPALPFHPVVGVLAVRQGRRVLLDVEPTLGQQHRRLVLPTDRPFPVGSAFDDRGLPSRSTRRIRRQRGAGGPTSATRWNRALYGPKRLPAGGASTPAERRSPCRQTVQLFTDCCELLLDFRKLACHLVDLGALALGAERPERTGELFGLGDRLDERTASVAYAAMGGADSRREFVDARHRSPFTRGRLRPYDTQSTALPALQPTAEPQPSTRPSEQGRRTCRSPWRQ